MGNYTLNEARVGNLISAIYDAAVDFNRWPDALRLIAETCGARAVVLTRQGDRSAQSWSIAPLCDPTYFESYANHYHQINPIWHRMTASQAGAVQTDEMVMSKRDFCRTEFYNDFLVPQHLGSILNAVVLKEDGRQTALAVHRKEEFGPEHIQLFRCLVPHVKRAVQLNIKIAQMQMRSEASIKAFGRSMLIVNRAARVIFADEQAERICGSSGSLRISNGRLIADTIATSGLLHSLIASAVLRGNDHATGGHLYLKSELEEKPLSLLIAPLRSEQAPFFTIERSVAAVFVADPNRNPQPFNSQLQKQFGLTSSEVLFAVELMKGHGIQSAADHLGIKRSTGRSHLARIFEKTGTHRQAELVDLMHRSDDMQYVPYSLRPPPC
ncbi:helix-turn-helix transcriptional regulator [Rhizobium sp.]|uniref:helix-turn-helix transcriptional regulator n=1 Tax=Rhizobium sp. TaxID=391 RepID=UPI002F23CBB9